MANWKQTEEVMHEYRKLSSRELWQKLFIYALMVTLAIVLLTILILKILMLIYGKTPKLDFVLLAESGVVFVLGGIFGLTMKSAINSVMTYIFMGTLLFIISVVVSMTFIHWGYIIF
ncbi:MAG: hypothetical protein ACW99Q_27130 [Candidatus Kariarchaeaceae archaeon]|jgi:hypothetical protein